MSIFASCESFLEIYISYIFFNKSFAKIRQISIFNENDPQNKTYCLMTLWIIYVIRFSQLCYLVLKMINLIFTLSFRGFQSWNYTDEPDTKLNDYISRIHPEHPHNFCMVSTAGQIIGKI